MRPNIALVLLLSTALVSSATVGKSQNTRPLTAGQQPQYDTIIIGRINTTVMTSRLTREMEQAERDDELEQRNRDQAAEDRAMLNKLIQYVVSEHLVPARQGLKSLVLTENTLTVNGAKQSENTRQAIRNKLGSWARNGLSYDIDNANSSLTIND